MHTLMSDSGARKKMFRDQFMSLCDLLAPPGARSPTGCAPSRP